MKDFDAFWNDLTGMVAPALTVTTAGRTPKPNTYTNENGVLYVSAEGGNARILPKATFKRAWAHLSEHGRLDRNSGITSNSSAVFALVAQLPYIATVTASPLVLAPKEEA